ncbi:MULTISPECIES: universal stress protein [unclassified Halorubrum]|uniref:universal stress protein n=1 Tax=unclassified Halorubrum TaxID=2642239 RepID=UPI000B98C07A|nr:MULTISPECIES: universal stress protein [unclassified Halorubrum]OYR47069.1 universal stress protein UspA [Halorubrum sp. Hd13]OYR52286.1 universal stress protein UspA [Halorubrum sp. Ea8]OYR55959.1 universal stress protein UspA [Halorubrum sp. Ea1]
MSADIDTADIDTADVDAADPADIDSTDVDAAGTAAPTATDDPAAPTAEGTARGGSLFERVLVVTGDDEAGRAAVDAGLDVAAAHGATVDALYVVDTTEHWDVVVERRERTGEALVEDAAARGEAAGVDVEKRFRYGTAHEEVLDFAAAHDADLIVVGSARRTGLDRLVHPETLPTRVQRGAAAPVMVVGADD